MAAEIHGGSYYRGRYYDPSAGRFISEAPVAFDGSDVNFYAYVSDSPVVFISYVASGVMWRGRCGAS